MNGFGAPSLRGGGWKGKARRVWHPVSGTGAASLSLGAAGSTRVTSEPGRSHAEGASLLLRVKYLGEPMSLTWAEPC